MKLIVFSVICIMFIPLISSGCIDENNNNNDDIDWGVYNEENFIPFKTENGEYLHGEKASISKNKIVYLDSSNKTKYSKMGIWIMNIDGSNKTLIYVNRSHNVDDSFTTPKFSSDGNKIIYSTYDPNEDWRKAEYSIDLLIKNGSYWNDNCIRNVIYKINKTIGEPIECSFNSDDSNIVYSLYRGKGGNGDIYIMNSNGSNHKQLTTHRGMDALPTFSPDNSKITWIHSDSGPDLEHIWIMNSDGSNKKRITPKDLDCSYPIFTSTGKILFVSTELSPHSNKRDAGNIWMMNPDGSNRTLIVPRQFKGNIWNTEPTISPDNTMIVFRHGLISDPAGLYFVKDLDGDGIWEDSDGDRVADVCDGAPNDPNEGYIKGNDSDFISSNGITPLLILLVTVAIFSKKKK